jgi:hypothetical protein
MARLMSTLTGASIAGSGGASDEQIEELQNAIDVVNQKMVDRGGIFLPDIPGFVSGQNCFAALQSACAISAASRIPIILPSEDVLATTPANTSLSIGKVRFVGVDKYKSRLLMSWVTDYYALFDVNGVGTSFENFTVQINPACTSTKLIAFRWRLNADDFSIRRCRLIGRTTLANIATFDEHLITDGFDPGLSTGLTLENNYIENFKWTFLQDSNSKHNKTKLRFIGNHVKNAFASGLGINSPSAQVRDAIWRDNLIELDETLTTSIHAFGIDVAGGDDIAIVNNHFSGDFVDAIHIEESTRRMTIQGNTGLVTRNAIAFMDGNAASQDAFYRSPRRNVITDNVFMKSNTKNGTTGSFSGFIGIFDSTNRGPLVDSVVKNNIMIGFQSGFYYHGIAATSVATVSNNNQEGDQTAVLASAASIHGNVAIECDVGFRGFDGGFAFDANRSVRCTVGATMRSTWVLNHTFEQCGTLFTQDTGGAALKDWKVISTSKDLLAAGTQYDFLTGASAYLIRYIDVGIRAQHEYGWGMYSNAKSNSGVTQPTKDFEKNHSALTHSITATSSALSMTVSDSSETADGYVMATIQGMATF